LKTGIPKVAAITTESMQEASAPTINSLPGCSSWQKFP
jgi:hypothetical protein